MWVRVGEESTLRNALSGILSSDWVGSPKRRAWAKDSGTSDL